MGRACSPPSMPLRLRAGWARSRPCTRCDACGCRIFIGRPENCAGATPRMCQQLGSVSTLRMIQKPIMLKSAARVGWVTSVHLTDTCDDDRPHLITHVETTPAPVADDATVPRIHEALAERDLLPSVHVVDTGYVDAEELVSSQQDYEVDLFGPTREDYHWQAREGTGFAADQFVVDWHN